MSAIGSFSGLASGVQWADLVDQIMNLETARKLTPITDRVSAEQARRDQWSAYESLLAKLNTAAAGIRDRTAFGYLNTAITNSPDGSRTLAIASASSSAVPGTYDLEVVELAKADKLSGSTFASTTTELAVSGEFYVNGRKVSLAATDSLTSIRDKINAVNSGSTASGVTATILTTSATEHRLVLTSDATGARGVELADGDTDTLEALGLVSATTSANVNPYDSSQTQSHRFSSTTTALASMLGVSTPPTVTTIDVNGTKITVDLENDTLLSVMNRIAAAGGTASLTEEEVDGDTFNRLTVDGTVTADAAASDPAASQRIVELLGFVQKNRASEITSGQDSVFRIDGFTMTRRTNTVSDAIEGVTLNLLYANGGDRTASVTGAGLALTTDPHTIDAGIYDIAITSASRSTSDSSGDLSVLAAPGTVSAGTYAVQITTAASVATTTGSGFDGTYNKLVGNDTMTVTDGNGNAGSVTLTNNKTTAQIVSDLNASFTANGAALVASDVGGQLRIEATGAKGGSSTFTVATSHSNVETELGIAPGTYNGTNVAGTIGGIAATGSGEVLTGSSGAVNGLQVQYTGTATGAVGTVTVADSISGVTIGGIAAEWDDATDTIRGADGTDFEGLELTYTGAATVGEIGELTIEGDIGVTMTVSRNLDTTVSEIEAFAAAYNEVVEFYDSQRGDPTAPLYANGAFRSMQRTLTEVLLDTVEGLPAGYTYTRGAVAGVALDDDGFLTVDAAALKSALETNFTEIMTLFGTSGVSTHGQVSFVDGTEATEPGTYAINITAAATQASHLGSVWGGNYVASNGVSDTLTITDSFSGASVDFVATQGMTLAEAVTELTELFENAEMGLTAVAEGGALRIRSSNYGTANTFTLAGTEAATRLGLTEATYAGTDVAGTIGGLAATGAGQILTGADGGITEGLSIKYTGSSTGAMGEINYVLGITGMLDRVVAPMTQSGDGTIALQLSSIDSSIETLNQRASDVEARLELRRQSLTAQFVRMEEALSMLNAQSQWLTSQIQALQSNKK